MEEMMKWFTTSGGFLTVRDGDRINTMTVAWGFIGYLWNKPCFVTLVRPQRHTQRLLENADSFTVSVPFGTMREELRICGTKSGADIDKGASVSFIPAKNVASPVVDGCDAYYECRINYVDRFDGAMIPESVRNAFYADDYHYVYIGEIVEAY